MSITDYRDLIVWQKGMALTKEVYVVSSHFPKTETYGLVSQIRRAAVSIPSNIAEGQGRNSDGDFVRFMAIANGSLREVETQLFLGVQLNFVEESQIRRCLEICNEVAKLLHGLSTKIQSRIEAKGKG